MRWVMIEKLKEYRFILVPLALGIILPSIAVPWVTIRLLGQYPFTPIDIIVSVISKAAGNVSQNQYDLLNLLAVYPDSYFALIFSMIIYIGSITMMGLSIAMKNISKFILIAGILAMSAGILWIYMIESFKINFVQTAVSAGGIIGEEWKGQENIIASSIIIMGLGHYIVILAGVVAILAYLWR